MDTYDYLVNQAKIIALDRRKLHKLDPYRDPIHGTQSAYLHTLNLIFERTFDMARKIAENKGKTKDKAAFKGFANVELTIDQKAEAKAWLRNLEDVQVEIDEMAASHYKISFMKSDATGGYQATAFCADTNSPNAGFILSAFAPHWFDALAMLAYKHAIVCEGIWPSKDAGTGDMWG